MLPDGKLVTEFVICEVSIFLPSLAGPAGTDEGAGATLSVFVGGVTRDSAKEFKLELEGLRTIDTCKGFFFNGLGFWSVTSILVSVSAI